MAQSGIRQTTWPFDPLNHFLFIQSIYLILIGYQRESTTSESSLKHDFSIIMTSLLSHFIKLKLFNRK